REWVTPARDQLSAGLEPCLSRVRISATPELTPLTGVHEEVIANFVARLRRQASQANSRQKRPKPGSPHDLVVGVVSRQRLGQGTGCGLTVRVGQARKTRRARRPPRVPI